MLVKILNFLLIIAIVLLIATAIRVLTYLIIGMPTDRIFSNSMYYVWGISIAIILSRILYIKSVSNKT